MRAGFYTFQPESTRIKASPKRENPIKTKDQYRLRNFFPVRQLVGPSHFALHLKAVLGLLLLPNCLAGIFHHCPRQPAREMCSRVYGLVTVINSLWTNRQADGRMDYC